MQPKGSPCPQEPANSKVLCDISWHVFFFYGEEFLAPRSTFKLQDHPLLAIRDCLMYLLIPSMCVEAFSSIPNSMTLQVVVKRAHITANAVKTVSIGYRIVQFRHRTFLCCKVAGLKLDNWEVGDYICLCKIDTNNANWNIARKQRINLWPMTSDDNDWISFNMVEWMNHSLRFWGGWQRSAWVSWIEKRIEWHSLTLCRGPRMRGAVPPLPHTSSSRDA
jgi:hypothetical protein